MSALRVLLIGTDTAESQHICSVLSDANHAVVPVPSFEEACEALLIQKFDAVLITPALPVDGVHDFTAQLRQVERNQRNAPRTPVVSVVANSSNPAPPGANGSIDAYLAGHFEPSAFAQTVEKLAQALAPASESSDNAAAAAELPVFSVAEFEEQVAYDHELMVEIIDLFLVERVTDMAEMAESLASGDLDQLMRGAHTIKGSLGSLHANLARYRSQELETAAKSGNRQACVALLSALEQDLEDLEPQLLSLRASAKPSNQ